jgi:hypothetical protein
LSSGLAHAKDTLECPLDERIMMTVARGRRYTGMRWSRIKSRISCSTGIKRRCVRCITGPRMKVKCCMLAVLRKSGLGNPLDHEHEIRSRWKKFLGVIHHPPQLIPNEIHNGEGSPAGHDTGKKVASKVS